MKNKLFKIWDFLVALIIQPIIKCIVSLCPLMKNKYFCMSMNGNNYGDSVKCLADYVSQVTSQNQIIWGFSDTYCNKVKCEYEKVRIGSVQYYYHILTSKYIICNFAFDSRFLKKRNGQRVLQTWHGTALKKIGYNVYTKEERGILYRWFGFDWIAHISKISDVWVSGSRYMTSIYRESFKYTKEIAEIGTPRNDIFFQKRPEIDQKIRTRYRIEQNKKILLYAPTFRADLSFTYYDVDLDYIVRKFEEMTGNDYVVMLRLHPNLLSKTSDFSRLFSDKYINVSSYPDMQELLYITDVLVTDYSSSMFDFMYLKRPVIMYVPDRDTYNRGFYLDIDILPFVVINNNSEIERKLSDFDLGVYQKKVSQFISDIGSVENGHATENSYKLLINS